VSFPEPKPGLVFRYDYLWARESVGRPISGKDRPACLVATVDSTIETRFVVILPITHSPPDSTTAAIEIPAAVRQALYLDDQPSWVIVSEYNVDHWPNPGVLPVPGQPNVFSYGFVPPRLFEAIREKFLAQIKRGGKATDRRE
jgi:hypothetical protein